MKQVFTMRFAAVFTISICIIFFINPLHIGNVGWRSALAGIVAGLAASLLARRPTRFAAGTVLGTTLTATVYAITYFGNLFDIGSILPRLFAAVVLGSLVGGVTDLLARHVHENRTATLLGALALTLFAMNVHAAPPNPEAAWASGYAAAVARACPEWHTDAAAIDRAGGVPDLLHGSDWAPGRPAAENYAAGARAADGARANTGFCDHPARNTPAHTFVSGFLVHGRLPE